MRYPIAPRGHTYVDDKPMVRFELTTLCLQSRCNNHYATSAQWLIICVLPEVGFEPTHPKIIELKSTALDRSAIQAQNQLVSQCWLTRQQWDLNSRGQSPIDFESIALTTRPCCLMLCDTRWVQSMQPTTRRIRTYNAMQHIEWSQCTHARSILNCTKQLSIHSEWIQAKQLSNVELGIHDCTPMCKWYDTRY